MFCVEARTRLGNAWEITMTDDSCSWEHLMQRTQQEVERDHLLRRAVVLVLPALQLVIPVSAFVAYADAVGVVVLYVAAFHGEGATVVEGAVTGHVEVIAGVCAEASLLV